MTEFRARIGRIRMKNGGAEVRLIEQPDPRSDRRGELLRHARAVAEVATENEPLVGHLVIGFFADGATSIGVYYEDQTCPIPRTLLPVWIEEIMRREMITDKEAQNIFHDMFYWRDGNPAS